MAGPSAGLQRAGIVVLAIVVRMLVALSDYSGVPVWSLGLEVAWIAPRLDEQLLGEPWPAAQCRVLC